MEFFQIKYFVAVARHKNFTKAAFASFVSQPSLSLQIKNLEKELGTKLFVRTKKTVHLTESGEQFLISAEKIMDELEKTKDNLAGGNIKLPRILRLGVQPIIANCFLPDVVKKFQQDHPEVSIKVIERPPEQLERILLANEVSLVLMYLPIEHRKVKSEILFQDSYSLFVSASHPLAKKKKVSFDDFMKEKFAVFSDSINIESWIMKRCELRGVKANIIYTSDQAFSVLNLCASGGGICFLPNILEKNALALGMKKINILEKEFEKAVGVAWPEKGYLSETAKVFMTSLRSASVSLNKKNTSHYLAKAAGDE
jgi:LysR family hydrogen peroxide-inducible transcriptional activator